MFKQKDGHFNKIGLNEIVDLEKTMRLGLSGLLEFFQNRIYWNDGLNFEKIEYKARDGLIPHSNNLGGLQLFSVIPECECDGWNLEFGQCENQDDEDSQCITHGCECEYLEAAVNVLFKIEEIENERILVYVNVSGGNGDAPYFRMKYLSDIYENEIVAKDHGELIDLLKQESKKIICSLNSKY